MKNKKKTILITGASGFIGNALFNKLNKEEYNVIGIDNLSRSKNRKNNKIIVGSIFNKYLLKKLVKKADIIVHLAAINGTRNFYNIPSKVFEVSLRGTLILYECLKEIKNKNKKILLASSGEVYGEPSRIPTDENIPLIISDILNDRYSYGGGKICQDLIARFLISSVVNECVVFRPHNVYGPNMGFDHVIPELIYKSLKQKKILKIEGTGKETRSFCYIDDFLNGLSILIKKRIKGFSIYNIGNNEEVTILKLVKIILKNLNKKLIIKKKKLRKGSTKRRCPDLKKIKKIGYKPHINLNVGIKKMIKNDSTLSKL